MRSKYPKRVHRICWMYLCPSLNSWVRHLLNASADRLQLVQLTHCDGVFKQLLNDLIKAMKISAYRNIYLLFINITD